MHVPPNRARRTTLARQVVGVVSLICCGAGPAWAAAEATSDIGPWLFGCLALLLVALLAYLAGARRAQSTRGADRAAPATEGHALPPSLTALLHGEPGEVRLCRRAAPESPWELIAAQPAARGPFDGMPPAVARLAQCLATDAEAQAEGWTLRRTGTGAADRLVLRRAVAAPGARDGADEQAAFSFTLSHDLRAPVRVVEGFARILKEDYGRQLDRIGNDHVDRVLVAAARMNSMIDAMLSMARLSTQPLARQPVNLSQLASYVVDDLRRNTPDRHVDVTIEPGLQAHGDPTLLRQMLDNLLSNAWKYSARCTQARISFTIAERDGQRVFEIKDNGAGFDMRSADRLFGLFQRLHSANDFPGTGIGLASVQRIVRRHGGDIWAEAEPGRGARFCFTLGS